MTGAILNPLLLSNLYIVNKYIIYKYNTYDLIYNITYNWYILLKLLYTHYIFKFFILFFKIP